MYDAQNLSLQSKIEVGHWVHYLAVHPGGKLVSVGADQENLANVIVWNLQTGKPTITLQGESGAVVTDVAFSPDGSRLAAGTNTGKVELWDLTNARLLRVISVQSEVDNAFVRHVLFSQDGSLIVAGADTGSVKVFDVASGQPLVSIEGVFRLSIKSLDISPDNNQIAVAGEFLTDEGPGTEQAGVIVFDTTTGDQISRMAETSSGGVYGGSVDLVSFSPDRRSLMVGSCLMYSRYSERCVQGILEVWNPQNGARMHVIREYGVGGPISGAYSPDAKRFAVITWDLVPLVEFIDTETNDVINTLEWYSGPSSPLAFTDDGQTVISGDPDGRIRFWDADSGRMIRTIGERGASVVNLALNRTNGLLASSGLYGPITLWDMENHASQTLETRAANQVGDLQFSLDGEWLGWIEIDGADTQVQLHSLSGDHADRTISYPSVYNAAISPDASMLALGAFGENQDKVRVYDTSTGGLLWEQPISKWVVSVGFTPDGTSVAAGCCEGDGHTLFWEASEAKYINTVSGALVAFFEDRPLMITAGVRHIWLWDMVDYTDIFDYQLDAAVRSIAISRDSQTIATPLTNGTALLWKVEYSNSE